MIKTEIKNRLDELLIKMLEMIDMKYPTLNITRLGMVVMLLGGLRVILGHNKARDTFRDYTHLLKIPGTDDELKMIIDFLEREIFSLTKSRMDIDVYKSCGKGTILPDDKYGTIERR